MDVATLSRTILLLNHRPISKVRLARIVYFVHKELIRKKFMQPEDIRYIRSPLGPVPEGFLTLERDSDDIVAQPNISSRLSYTAEDYAINNDSSEETSLEQYRDILGAIERILKALLPYSTPDLVRVSHRDPSWQSHANGELYTITPADLKNTFPVSNLPIIRIKIRFSKPTKAGAMQANLLRGMIADIVRESTDLEHPDQAVGQPTQNPPKPPIAAPAGNEAKSRTKTELNPFALVGKHAKPRTKPEQKPKSPGKHQ